MAGRRLESQGARSHAYLVSWGAHSHTRLSHRRARSRVSGVMGGPLTHVSGAGGPSAGTSMVPSPKVRAPRDKALLDEGT